MKPGQNLLHEALALHKAGQLNDAEALYERAISANPSSAQAHYLAGLLQQQCNHPEHAVGFLREAAALAPTNADFHAALGATLLALHHYSEAIAVYAKVISLQPTAMAHNNHGVALFSLRRLPDALQSFDAALALDGALAAAHNNRANVLRDLKQLDAAIESYEKAVALAPDFVEAYVNLGNARARQKRYVEAVETLSIAHRLQPGFRYVAGYLLHAKMLCCDWVDYDTLKAQIDRDVDDGKKAAEPFGYQAIATSPARLKKCAEIFATDLYPPQPPLFNARRKTGDKIRIGYLCGEFRDQATSILMTQVFERHDKRQFDVFAFDNGWDDGSILRQRMARAFTAMIDISKLGDIEAANIIRDQGIDILVNLNGYFGDNRPGVFAFKPAPIQANYLGFPGTLGAAYIDYIIADETVIPHTDQSAYTEHVVYLPDSYQANDAKRMISDAAVSRADAHLPADQFVFCCFNNNYKITPDTFSSWMRILNRAPQSVLWLLEDNATAAQNLRRAAEKAGIEGTRIIFAQRLNLPEHLARHRLADLFLDTLPYNAHTTASDALWAGLPLLTCLGQTFPGRVSASLLKALDMPELVTSSLEEFENTGVALAFDTRKVADLKAQLSRKRQSAPLFNAARFTGHLEDAYREMVRRHQNSAPPTAMTVKPRV